ncbi:MAG: DEAD/DEAH box helicase [Thermofilum sp.]|jgi:superfamily II DNA or RNA helicase|uniref:DEAD/DEAH box helicase n=1 Tax=Thermofilum sp. TaxID=1961369 RepID=UPI002583EE6B|nr:DEAD/DEAH box helicase [Thermofilum sp.]MCI4409767.1 DEAD/DEAH box helicase [Thermofilum sp.]
MTLKEFNEAVRSVRKVLHERGIEFPSNQLEYEIARLIAKYDFPPDVDIVNVLNEIADNLDSTLSLSENLEIAEAIIGKYVSLEERLSYKDVEYMIKTLEEWNRNQAEEYAREYYEQQEEESGVEWWQIFNVPRSLIQHIETTSTTITTVAVEPEKIEQKVLEVRDYQIQAIETWKRTRRGVVVMPTGTGKTYVALRIIFDALASNPKTHVAVIVPLIELAQQWKKRMREFGLYATLYYGEEKRISRVTIFVLNSAYLNMRLLRLFDIIIIDEIHHLRGENFQKIIHEIRDKDVLGLTATPELGSLQHFIPIIFRMSYNEAREKGAIVDIDVVPIHVDMTPEEKSKYLEIEEKMENIAKLIEKLRNSDDKEDKAELEELELRYRILADKRKRLMSRIEEKRRRVVEIAKSHEGEKIIVFTESIESAETIKNELVSNGVKAETYHSQKPDTVRRRILATWGKAFSVLVTVRALDEGIDVPEVRIGIVVASGTSTRQITQRLGRILRPAPGKEKATLYVLVARNTYESEILSKIREIAGKNKSVEIDNYSPSP